MAYCVCYSECFVFCSGERLVCITDLLEGISVQLGDASTNTTPKKPPSPNHKTDPPNHNTDPLQEHNHASPGDQNFKRNHLEKNGSSTEDPQKISQLQRSSSVIDSACNPLSQQKRAVLFRSNSSPFTTGSLEESLSGSFIFDETSMAKLDLKVRKCSKSQIYVLRPLR